jgi:glycerophosphoryl diester phosphodiesterase
MGIATESAPTEYWNVISAFWLNLEGGSLLISEGMFRAICQYVLAKIHSASKKVACWTVNVETIAMIHQFSRGAL